MTKKLKDYNKNYTCSKCKLDGVKLWRQYQTCASAVDLLCVVCAVADQKKESMSVQKWTTPFDFSDGDQIGWLVPAIPTAEGDTFWGYTSVPSDRVQWWHSLPTYKDNPLLELACFKNLFAKSLAGEHWVYEKWSEEQEKVRDLTWQLERRVFVVVEPDGVNVTIWGTKEVPLAGGMVLRHGEDQPRKLVVGERIALHHDRAVVLDDAEHLNRCYSITDCDSDGKLFVQTLVTRGLIRGETRR